jgi:zinc protease
MISQRQKISITLLIVSSLLLWFGLQANVLLAMPPVQRTVLHNGLVLLVGEDHSLPFVTIQLLIDSGSRKDPSGKEGLANITAKGLLLGTSIYSTTAINEELDYIGASLNVLTDEDYATLLLRVLRKDLDKGFDIFVQTFTQPTFPKEELRKETQKILAAIQSDEEQPEVIAEKTFQRTLFLDSPYGHPAQGTKESLAQLTREDIVQFYETYYHPNNAILTIVGDITAEEIRETLIPRLLKWPMGTIPAEQFKTTFAKGPKIVKIDREITQANIIIGHQGISRGNPDFYALTVMNFILGGGGFGSRLMDEIRVKRGLVYSVASYFDPGKYPGSFQIVLQTKNTSAREAISLSLQQMVRIQESMVSEQELERATKYLTGSFPLRLDTQLKLAHLITQLEYYGLGLDYPKRYSSLIRSVTREDILRVAQAYLHPDNYIIVVVANLKEAGMD